MIDQKRRTVLKATLAGGVLAGVAGSGLLMPDRLLAAGSQDAFMATTLQDALNAVYSGAEAGIENTQTDAISFEDTKEAPANPRSVPISVSSTVPNTRSISVFIEKNPRPLVARFAFEPNAIPTVHIRAKMKETSRVIAVVEDAQGKRLSRAMRITVTESGCGA
uniref:Sulfur-oxidizing protein SoxY n=1 Tax=Candidatus Kentrum eta TaxID=2126337 RepID=A0A450UDM9_9GAMM|nr:MAG: sulfur-oxidizing protein SoxY [Candidatus Kentron sp. H]VFJ90448.1 MAG: sulfur-oxidizing protein SoxY [Candidatus Kentron sp. H]VFJ97084.1 MAG: sulfur-oxidizing protein SoxY [Candidatus Kentron sp. H]